MCAWLPKPARLSELETNSLRARLSAPSFNCLFPHHAFSHYKVHAGGSPWSAVFAGDDWHGVDASNVSWTCLTGSKQSPINIGRKELIGEYTATVVIMHTVAVSRPLWEETITARRARTAWHGRSHYVGGHGRHASAARGGAHAALQ